MSQAIKPRTLDKILEEGNIIAARIKAAVILLKKAEAFDGKCKIDLSNLIRAYKEWESEVMENLKEIYNGDFAPIHSFQRSKIKLIQRPNIKKHSSELDNFNRHMQHFTCQLDWLSKICEKNRNYIKFKEKSKNNNAVNKTNSSLFFKEDGYILTYNNKVIELTTLEKHLCEEIFSKEINYNFQIIDLEEKIYGNSGLLGMREKFKTLINRFNKKIKLKTGCNKNILEKKGEYIRRLNLKSI